MGGEEARKTTSSSGGAEERYLLMARRKPRPPNVAGRDAHSTGLSHDDNRARGGAELAGGAALVDGDFQHAGRSEDGDDLAGVHVGVGGSQRADAQRTDIDRQIDGRADRAGEVVLADVGDQVAEVINVEHLPLDAALRERRGRFQIQDFELVDDRADVDEAQAAREVAGDGREDISAMEGRADVLAEEARVGDLAKLVEREVAVDEADDAIVRSEYDLAVIGSGEQAAGGTDAGVDDDDVDRPFGEVVEGLAEDEGAVDDVVGGDGMGDVDDLGGRGLLEDDAFHAGDVVVGRAEVGGEGDDRHALRRAETPAPVVSPTLHCMGDQSAERATRESQDEQWATAAAGLTRPPQVASDRQKPARPMIQAESRPIER